ncbi:hypothetical protein ACEQ8H_002756 [Pleosporales sp. CAS-2024a]
MSSALAKASTLKPEIRLAQAVSQFEADLSDEQRGKCRTEKLHLTTTPPDLSDVMRLTAKFDRQILRNHGGQCFGPRFTYFLEGVQQFAALGDIIVGGSQNLIACGVWSLVRMSILSIVSTSTYVEKLSSLFMDIGRACPRHQAMVLLYPRSTKLQSYLFEYFILVVNLCRYIYLFGQKSVLKQLASALSDARLQTFRSELDQWATKIKEEISLHENQENSGFRALFKKLSKTASDQQNLVTKLSLLDLCSKYNHQTVWKQIRKSGCASFFEQAQEYLAWRESAHSSTLICTGKLGSGKSVLLANIVDNLNLFVDKRSCAVTYFFCKRDTTESLQARTILGSLARQMLCTLPDLVELSKRHDVTSATGDFEDILKLLLQGFPLDRQAYIVLDGLDECDETERGALLEGLQKIQASLKVSVCTSVRSEPYADLQSVSGRLADSCILPMPDDNPDIDNFIDADLERCLDQNKLRIGDPALILEIRDALLRGSQGMFLWVALQIQSLCNMKTDEAMREALKNLPKDLSETFQRILEESGSEYQSLQAKILRLVMAAQRPLTTDELREALSVNPGDATWDPAKILNDVHSALACCGCLLTLDEEESTVQFVHHSVRQFILDASKCGKNVHFTLKDAQRTMADVVVTYLNYGIFGTELSRAKVQLAVPQSISSQIVHATLRSSSTAGQFAMRLLKSRRQPAFDMSKVIAETRRNFTYEPGIRCKFLVFAASHWQDYIFYVSGQDPVMLRLSSTLIRLRISEFRANAPSFWTQCCLADENGNRAILEQFLKTNKEENIVGLKLLHEFDNFVSDEKNKAGQTPLLWSVIYGHKELLALLLKTGKVDVNAADNDGGTPLIRAASLGFNHMTELLLDTGKVDVDARATGGWTALIQASSRGFTSIVELLLSTGKVDINVKDVMGRTPLMVAVKNGHVPVVELLLDTGKVDVNARDSDGYTPLIRAASQGSANIIELLLSTSKVDINAKNHMGTTPLVAAAGNDRTGVVRLLLCTENIDVDVVDAKDRNAWTPLLLALSRRNRVMVELLLRTGKVDVYAETCFGETALDIAKREGMEDLLEDYISKTEQKTQAL